MAQSLSHILVHVIFSTKERKPLITKNFRPQLHAYLSGVCRELSCECYRVGGIEDHVHLAIDLPRTTTLSELIRKVKAASSKWAKAHSPDFAWQSGYGAFSLSFSHLQALCEYIDSQEQHHKTTSFQDEYLNLLKKLNIDYNPEHIWTP